jgi:hypothetical protein
MADTFRILVPAATAALAATTTTDIYIVPASTSTTVSSITVCNRGSTPCTFRISVAIGNTALANGQYIYYDQPLDGNSTFVATIGLTLATTDRIRAYASTANVSVNVFGVEVT